MRDVALIGQARSGKDTVGSRLVERYGYTRLAFADPLKEMAIDINPYVPTVPGVCVRLASLIADVGWEYAKEHYPEVRRILQHTGQTVRDRDPDYWVRVLVRRMLDTPGPIVVTDVRYPNELETLRNYGFRTVRIIRPSLGDPDLHESENALEHYDCGVTVMNHGTLDDLRAHADTLPH